MWREPGFKTRNNQAQAAKAEPLDRVFFGAPILKGVDRQRGPNLQQLPRFAELPPVRKAIAEPAWPDRFAAVPGDGGVLAPLLAMPGCRCTMCVKVREGEARKRHAMRGELSRMEAVLLDEFIGQATPAMLPTIKAGPSDKDISDAIALAAQAGRLAQALRDTLCSVSYFASQANNRSASGQPHRNLVDEFMSSKGWSVAGNGHFSVAYVKDKLCIKLGFKSEDSGAMYAAFCRDNKGLKGLPNVMDMQHHGRHSYTVVMPALKPLDGPNKAALSNAWMEDGGRTIGPNVMRLLRSWGVDAAGIRIRSFFNGVATMDLHGDNVMRDDAGNFIITDPVSFKQ